MRFQILTLLVLASMAHAQDESRAFTPTVPTISGVIVEKSEASVRIHGDDGHDYSVGAWHSSNLSSELGAHMGYRVRVAGFPDATHVTSGTTPILQPRLVLQQTSRVCMTSLEGDMKEETLPEGMAFMAVGAHDAVHVGVELLDAAEYGEVDSAAVYRPASDPASTAAITRHDAELTTLSGVVVTGKYRGEKVLFLWSEGSKHFIRSPGLVALMEKHPELEGSAVKAVGVEVGFELAQAHLFICPDFPLGPPTSLAVSTATAAELDDSGILVHRAQLDVTGVVTKEEVQDGWDGKQIVATVTADDGSEYLVPGVRGKLEERVHVTGVKAAFHGSVYVLGAKVAAKTRGVIGPLGGIAR